MRSGKSETINQLIKRYPDYDVEITEICNSLEPAEIRGGRWRCFYVDEVISKLNIKPTEINDDDENLDDELKTLKIKKITEEIREKRINNNERENKLVSRKDVEDLFAHVCNSTAERLKYIIKDLNGSEEYYNEMVEALRSDFVAYINNHGINYIIDDVPKMIVEDKPEDYMICI